METVNELEMHKLKKKLDEFDEFIEFHILKGLVVTEEVRNDYKEIRDTYNHMIKIHHEASTKDFLDKISV
jgi:hypothetical protein